MVWKSFIESSIGFVYASLLLTTDNPIYWIWLGKVSALKTTKLIESLKQIELRGAKWTGLAVAGVCYGLYKRTLVVQ
jgi:hypothetical protein